MSIQNQFVAPSAFQIWNLRPNGFSLYLESLPVVCTWEGPCVSIIPHLTVLILECWKDLSLELLFLVQGLGDKGSKAYHTISFEKAFSSYLRMKIIPLGACLRYLLCTCSDESKNAETICSSYSILSVLSEMEKWAENWYCRKKKKKVATRICWVNSNCSPKIMASTWTSSLERRWTFCYFAAVRRLLQQCVNQLTNMQKAAASDPQIKWDLGSQQHLLQLHKLSISRKKTQVQRALAHPV